MCNCSLSHCVLCPERTCSPLVSSHEQVTGAHLEVCPNYPLDCPNRCGAQGITRSAVPAHQEVCPLQLVECEYKRFGCAVVLPRKDIAEHLKTSVQAHLQMTKRRVEEQEVYLQKQEEHLKNVEKTAEREHQAMREKVEKQEQCLQQMRSTLAHLAMGKL